MRERLKDFIRGPIWRNTQIGSDAEFEVLAKFIESELTLVSHAEPVHDNLCARHRSLIGKLLPPDTCLACENVELQTKGATLVSQPEPGWPMSAIYLPELGELRICAANGPYYALRVDGEIGPRAAIFVNELVKSAPRVGERGSRG